MTQDFLKTQQEAGGTLYRISLMAIDVYAQATELHPLWTGR